MALIVIGGVFTFGAVATNPQLPMSVASPFTDVVVPAVQHDAVALGTQSYLDATPDRAVPTHHDRDAWNLGLLMGLPGWWSVLPLVAVWVVAARAIGMTVSAPADRDTRRAVIPGVSRPARRRRR